MPRGRKRKQRIGIESPLSVAISGRDRDVLDMVANALHHKEALLAYQPIVHSPDPTRPAFYEGFIRVLDATGRIIPARDFITEAETTELGRMLDCVALEMGLDVLARVPGLRLAINMSARSIGYPRWVKSLRAGLRRNSTVAERLILEISESSAVTVPDLVSTFMSDLQSKGITFALDDFGAGYTCFRHLRGFYFDILKIDGAFVRGVAQKADNQVTIKAMVALAQQFDMFTVAESVENQTDAQWLTQAGLDCQQGYLHGAPTVSPSWSGKQAPNHRAFG